MAPGRGRSLSSPSPTDRRCRVVDRAVDRGPGREPAQEQGRETTGQVAAEEGCPKRHREKIRQEEEQPQKGIVIRSMSKRHGLIYEVTLTVDRQLIESVDGWLAEHVESMLELPGFLKADTFSLDDDEQGRKDEEHQGKHQLRWRRIDLAGVRS